MAPKPSTPAYFGVLLERRWAEGITKVRRLFAEIRHRGYTGSYSRLARFLAPWRADKPSLDDDQQVCDEQEEPAPVRVRTLDAMTGRAISPLTAAALCVKPRGQMTARQVANVAALEAASPEFKAMRHLAMRFRGLLRGGTPERLDAWLIDAHGSGTYGMQRFARTIRPDLDAVRNAVSEPWSNGQTEGQINRLKTLKRAMYGRAGVDLLRARMMPFKKVACTKSKSEPVKMAPDSRGAVACDLFLVAPSDWTKTVKSSNSPSSNQLTYAVCTDKALPQLPMFIPNNLPVLSSSALR